MKKRKIAMICLSAVLLAGCGDAMPEMTDEQAELIGEYAAITLMKYDAAGRSRLVDLSQIEEKAEEPSAAPTIPVPEQPAEKETPETPIVDKTVKEELTTESLGSCLDLPEGVSLLYEGYDLEASYQTGASHLAVEASEGNQLLVLHFTLRNTSGADQEIDLLRTQNTYRVTVNDDYVRNVQMTMLDNDLLTYSGTLSNGGTEEVVLLAEVESNRISGVDSLALNLKNGSETYTIRLF